MFNPGPICATCAALSALRPHLPPALATLNDAVLLALVRAAIRHAWADTVREAAAGGAGATSPDERERGR